MEIQIETADKGTYLKTISHLVSQEFEIPLPKAELLVEDNLGPHIERLVDSVWMVIESPYVDKVYRDSFYAYFSTKSRNYKKNCIRISFFSRPISEDSFRDDSKLEYLKSNFWGFMVLVPTSPGIIARSVISPVALKNNGFVICQVGVPITAKMVKLKVNGIPHSSQTGETKTCA